MLFKTLKHKTLEDTYAHVDYEENLLGEVMWEEVNHISVPTLHPMTADMEGILSYWKKISTHIHDEIEKNYILITVELNII